MHPDDSTPSAGLPALRFSLGGFPVTVQLWFVLTAWFVGPRSGDLLRDGPWILVVFAGVLAHELGHALALRRLEIPSAIELHGFGGATMWSPSRSLTPWQRIGVSAAGPAVGLTIGLLAILVARSGAVPVPRWVLVDVIWVNLGWGVLNLLPILPLDGGTIVATFAEMVAGRRGVVVARWFSVGLTVAIAVWGVVSGDLWLVVLGAVLTFANWQALQTDRPSGPALGR